VTNALLGTAIAGAIALGFALVGEVLLGRASRDLFAWNESFLIGIGACAAALFPLSVALRGRALDAELALLGAAALLAAWRRVRRKARPEPASGSGGLGSVLRDPLAVLLLAGILSLLAFFGVYNLWYGNDWDSVQVFGTKALRLFTEGGLSRSWFPEDVYDSRLLSYPPLVSLFEALFSRVRGGFDFDRYKPLFAYFYVSLLLGTYAAARSLCSRRWALCAVLLVALLPGITTGSAAGGYVDMPLAAFVAAAAAAGLRTGDADAGWRSPLPWLLGAMTAVKQEGMILALIGCGAIVLFWLGERPRRLAARVRTAAPSAAVVLAFIVLRVGYVRWIGVHDLTWGPFDAGHRLRALHSVPLVASLCLRWLLHAWTWGLFWPAFFAAALLVAATRQTRPAILAVAVTTAVAAEAGLFLFTNWDIKTHIDGGYTRLLVQLAPAAAAVIAAAASRIWSPAPGKAA
jgi:hypothetical protein